MSYVGQTLPVDRFSGYLTETFTGDGSTTAFTLTREPHSESAIIIVINNVVQQPTEDYTVSGTTLTIDAAVASGDVIYATHTGGVLPITESATIDLQGVSDALVLDSDADSTLSADTDDQLDIKLGGSDIGVLTTSALTLKNSATADDSTFTVNIQTAEADIAINDVIGAINFQAPNEGTGTDAILVAAGIEAISEGDFSSSSNATKLSFKTGASEAAASKMTLSSAGALDVTGDVTGSTLNADGDTAAGDNAAMGYTSGEGLILTGQGSTNDITIKNDADADVITIATGTTVVGVPGSIDLAGAIDVDGTANLDVVDIDGAVDMASTLQVDGAITTSDGMVITTADVNPHLTIISTEAGANASPILDLYRNSSSPADDDVLGQFRYYGENSADEKIEYVRVKAGISDVTDSDEASNYTITTYTAGSQYGRLNILELETVFNENTADIDFRVETDDNANAFIVDAGAELIKHGVSTEGGCRPSFSAHKDDNAQTIANNTNTLVTFETEIFDSDSKFASSRFTPTVAGQYFFAATVAMTNHPTDAYVQIQIWKNGSNSFSLYTRNDSDADETDISQSASWVFDMDSDDYVEIYIRQNSGGNENTRIGQELTFSGFRIN